MSELEGAIGDCKQQGDSMIDYFGKLTKMWNELANYEKAPNYCCNGLNCKRIADRERQREEKRLHKFLVGLSPSFRAIIS